MNLRQRLAHHGFESNDDYQFALRCLFEAKLSHLRVLQVDGASGRRKTAFATALAHALDYPHVLYHDFSHAEPPAPVLPVTVADDAEPGPVETPMSAFERAMTEACAYSEAERTILILDQLQAADFAEHIRLQRFAASGEWHHGSSSAFANPRHLLLVLISEAPLYHSLARISFRIWTDAQRAFLDYRPEDYGLQADAQAMFNALTQLFEHTSLSPTPTEFGHLLQDLLLRARSQDQLRQVLFGRIEGVERERLETPGAHAALTAVIEALSDYLAHDHIELDGPA